MSILCSNFQTKQIEDEFECKGGLNPKAFTRISWQLRGEADEGWNSAQMGGLP